MLYYAIFATILLSVDSKPEPFSEHFSVGKKQPRKQKVTAAPEYQEHEDHLNDAVVQEKLDLITLPGDESRDRLDGIKIPEKLPIKIPKNYNMNKFSFTKRFPYFTNYLKNLVDTNSTVSQWTQMV